MPYYQLALAEMQLVVESDDDAGAVVSRVKRVLGALDPSLPIAKVSRIEDLVSASIAQPRFNMALLIGLAVLRGAARGGRRLRRRHLLGDAPHVGDRPAHGARRRRGDTFRLVVTGALRVVLAGVVLGASAPRCWREAFDSLLFGVPPLDVVTFAAAGRRAGRRPPRGQRAGRARGAHRSGRGAPAGVAGSRPHGRTRSTSHHGFRRLCSVCV